LFIENTIIQNPKHKLEELIETKIKTYEKIDVEDLNELKGNFLNLITCYNGSRIMQKALAYSSYKIIHQILKEIEHKLNELMVDPYANYFCQKFYEYLNLDDRLIFLERVRIINYVFFLIKYFDFKFLLRE